MDALQLKSSRRCPQCAAYVTLEATDCWLCHAKLPPLGAVIMASIVPEADNAKRPFQYGLSSILLVITFAAILCSLIKMSPGLGIAVAILTTPAMLRTILVAFRQRQSGEPMSAGDKANIFFLTMAMSLGVIVAACGAFCVTFFLTCAASLAGNSKADPFVASFVVGGIAALIVAIFISLTFWRAGRRGRSR
jgi:hypothetical protein